MKLRLVFCLLIFSIYSSHLSSQDILMGIKEVDPGSTPHKLTLFYTFQADFVAPARHIWNSQLFMLRYSTTLPVPNTFVSGTVDENCFGWTGFNVGEFNGHHYIVYTDSDGATCPFNNNQVIDMLTISFDNTTTAFSTANFEIVPLGDPSITHFGFGAPAINNAASGINEFNGFNPGVVINLVLPLKLIAFSAESAGANTILNWETSSEINFSHYDIQRSTNQRNWKHIGTVLGKGDADNTVNYQWIDREILSQTSSDKLFYRLKMVDVDNAIEYSSIKYIHVNKATKDLRFYPNPVNDILNIDLRSWVGAPIVVTLFDFQSKKVFEQNFITSSKINVRALPKGIYLLEMKRLDGEILLTKSVIIQ